MDVLTSDDSKRKLTPTELQLVLESLAASRSILVENGRAVARKHKGEKDVLLNLQQSSERGREGVERSGWIEVEERAEYLIV